MGHLQKASYADTAGLYWYAVLVPGAVKVTILQPVVMFLRGGGARCL